MNNKQKTSTPRFPLLHNHNFLRLLLARAVTEIGTALTMLAASIYVYQLTGSALNVGLMLIVTILPSLLIGLVAGVFVDRYNRKHIMIIAELLRALLIFAIPFLLPFSTIWLYLLVLLSSAVGQFFEPAQASVLPEVVKEEELGTATSIIELFSAAAFTIGFALAGLITGSLSIAWAFYLDAFTFILSAILIAGMQLPAQATGQTSSVSVVLSNLRTGIETLTSTPILRSLFLVYLPFFTIFGLLRALFLPFAIEELKATEFQYGLLEGAPIVGFLPASILMARFSDRLRDEQWLVVSFTGIGIVAMLFAITSYYPLAVVIIMAYGSMLAPETIVRTLIIQRNSERTLRGRLFSAFFVLRNGSIVLGMASVAVADFIDIRFVYFMGGVLFVGVGIMAHRLFGLTLSAAEWRRIFHRLRSSPPTSPLGEGRPLLPTDWARLVKLVPAWETITPAQRQQFAPSMQIFEVARNAPIRCADDKSGNAYLLLAGQAVAGLTQQGEECLMETLRPGDFFGDLPALTEELPRRGQVVAETPATLLQLKADVGHELTRNLTLNCPLIKGLSEHIPCTRVIDLPGANSLEQQVMSDLRTPASSFQDRRTHDYRTSN